jgi:pimeloyl-ACP methyl ester carboxylesterase
LGGCELCEQADRTHATTIDGKGTVVKPIYRSPAGEQAVMALYDAALARWPVPYTPLHIPTRHGTTFVIASGDAAAPPLVLLHGAGTNSSMWAGDVERYSHSFRVYAVDLPGEAGKSAPNRPPWNGPAFAEWLSDVLGGLHLQTVTILGLSQGAWTALRFAVTYPDRVGALVLLTPGGIVPDRIGFALRALPLLLLGRRGIRRINRMVLAGQSVPAEVEQAMTVMMTHFKARIGALPLFSDPELRRLTMPVQLVIGERDALRDARKIAARMQRVVPHLTTTIVPDAGHALVGSQPYILPFLAKSLAADRDDLIRFT